MQYMVRYLLSVCNFSNHFNSSIFPNWQAQFPRSLRFSMRNLLPPCISTPIMSNHTKTNKEWYRHWKRLWYNYAQYPQGYTAEYSEKCLSIAKGFDDYYWSDPSLPKVKVSPSSEPWCHERTLTGVRTCLRVQGSRVESSWQLLTAVLLLVCWKNKKAKSLREGPTDPKVSMKSGVSGVFPEWFQEIRSSGELRSYNIK